MKYLGILFMWMKYFHITKHNLLYNKINEKILKYSWGFYLLKILYPIWIIIGIFGGNFIYILLLILGLIKYLIYPLIKDKVYRYYELLESIVCVILYIILIFKY